MSLDKRVIETIKKISEENEDTNISKILVSGLTILMKGKKTWIQIK